MSKPVNVERATNGSADRAMTQMLTRLAAGEIPAVSGDEPPPDPRVVQQVARAVVDWLQSTYVPQLHQEIHPRLDSKFATFVQRLKTEKLVANSNGRVVWPKELTDLVNHVVELTKEHVALKRRVLELQARPALEEAGVWRESADYRVGHVVTCDGSAFVCRKAPPKGRPGQTDDWRLLVKRGKDGKDARGR